MAFAMDLVGYNTACEDDHDNNGDNKDDDDNLKLWISK